MDRAVKQEHIGRTTVVSIMIVAALLVAMRRPIVSAQSGGGDQNSVAASTDETSDLWFVELSSPPIADGTSLAQVRQEKAAFRSAAAAARLPYTERYAFDTLWNGLSVRIDRRDLAALSRTAGVKRIYPVAAVAPSWTQSDVKPALFTSKTMIGADVVQSQLGYTGVGVRVAVIDSGIDYTHPDLGGCLGPGCRVEGGYDFVGDAFDGTNTPAPDSDPMDCLGHGTHVSGIIGAKAASPAGVTGVAPGVTFRAYRVFGCVGGTTDDILIAAMERALADGVEVVNMSLGSVLTWRENPAAQAATRLVNKGITVVAAAGNFASLGLYGIGAPAVADKVISVASFDNLENREPYFTISPDALPVGYEYSDGPLPPTSGTQPMKRTGTTTSTADACAPLAPGSVAGFVALIREGTCSYYQKAINAQNAGALGVAIYTSVPRVFLSPTVAGTPAVTIPVVGITADEGAAIDSRLASGPATMAWTNQTMGFPEWTAGLTSNFSSYGLSPELDVKPDIGAPGGGIYSTFPVALGSYITGWGTSMASPHVAGAVALLLEARPHAPSNAIRSILQNSAVPAPWFGNPALGYLDTVQKQGAGMLHIDRAILATTMVEPGKLSLGESVGGPAVRTLRITNASDTDLTYDLSHAPALSTGPNTFSIGFTTGFASVTFSTASVTVPAGGQASVDVVITANPALPDRSVYDGYLVLTARGSGAVTRVAYAGFKGDYQSVRVLAPTTRGFPWLAARSGSLYFNQPHGASYSMQGIDIPYFVVHLDHQSRLLRATIESASGKDWHTAFELAYLSRNSSSSGAFIYAWDGTTSTPQKTYTVPNGDYRLTITVVKALGDENNPADVETWTSPVITIARP
jgi:minor extracellular serine protease Vpr